jgi:16S rRNA (guanine527-N7)-methyltransferase
MTNHGLSGLSGFALDDDTFESLRIHADLVAKWTRRINLVSRTTVDSLWVRHTADSAQLFPLIPVSARRFVDLGSGGGFPGLVLAILSRQGRPGSRTVLIESDQRKAAFLREAIRLTGAPAEVLCSRAMSTPPQSADVVTARAVADLSLLLGLVSHHMGPNGVALLPKGASFEEEIALAGKEWMFDAEVFPSQTDRQARILRVTQLSRRTGNQ